MMTNYSNAIFLLHDKARMMLGIFEADASESNPTAKREPFKTLDPTIKEGDLVVVETFSRHNASVVKIVKADVPPNFSTTEQTRWIIQKVDSTMFAQLKEMEQQAIDAVKAAELKKERAELKKTMFADYSEELNALPIITDVKVNGEVKVLTATAAPK
jgi:hypothetical protein